LRLLTEISDAGGARAGSKIIGTMDRWGFEGEKVTIRSGSRVVDVLIVRR
jgi:hypothetical protein